MIGFYVSEDLRPLYLSFFGDSSQCSNIDFIEYSYYLYCELTAAVVRSNTKIG